MVSIYATRFSENLKLLLKENNLSVREFAKKVEVPSQTINRYILCQREIKIEYLCKIADYFNEDIDVLIGRKEF